MHPSHERETETEEERVKVEYKEEVEERKEEKQKVEGEVGDEGVRLSRSGCVGGLSFISHKQQPRWRGGFHPSIMYNTSLSS